MEKIFAIPGQNLMELILAKFPFTNSMETLFDSALTNGCSISDIPEPGQEFILLEPDKKARTTSRSAMMFLTPIFKVVKNDRQNLQDLSIQTTGTFENLFELALLNGVSVTENGDPGKKYVVYKQNVNEENLRYFSSRKIRPETGTSITITDCYYAVCDYVEKEYWT